MRALLTVCGYQSAAMVGQSVIERAPRWTERFPGDHAAAQLQSASSSYAWPKERLTELPILQLGEPRRSWHQRDITRLGPPGKGSRKLFSAASAAGRFSAAMRDRFASSQPAISSSCARIDSASLWVARSPARSARPIRARYVPISRGTVNLIGSGRDKAHEGQSHEGLCPSGHAGDLGPGLKGLGPGGSVLGGGAVIAAEMEQVADLVVGREEALSLAG